MDVYSCILQWIPGKRWRENAHSLLPSIPGLQMVWNVPVSKDLPMEFLPEGTGGGRGVLAEQRLEEMDSADPG